MQYQEIILWIFTALWLVWCIRIRPRKQSQRTPVERTVVIHDDGKVVIEPIEQVQELFKEEGFDPMRKTVDQLKYDVIKMTRKKQKEQEKK